MIDLNKAYNSTNLQNIAHYVIAHRGFNVIDTNLFKNRDIIWSHTDRVLELFPLLQDDKNSYILITGVGDMPVNEWLFSLKPKCIKKWFAINTDYVHPDLVPLPLGFGQNKSPFRCNITNFDAAEKIFNLTPTVENKIINQIHVSFSIEPYPNHRNRVKEILYKNKLVQTKKLNNANCSATTQIPWEENINDSKKYLFVASPRGNGIQCHRTWEILFSGCIPIVDRHFSYDHCCKNLPLIQVDNWEQITLQFLEPWISLYKEGKLFKNTEELTLEYWEKKIIQARKEL
jgi:hypothetical protein